MKKSTFFFSNIFSEYIDYSPNGSIIRQRFDGEKNDKRKSSKVQDKLSRIAFWGMTITVTGLAIYFWNQAQATDSTKFISLGDFLAQLYR